MTSAAQRMDDATAEGGSRPRRATLLAEQIHNFVQDLGTEVEQVRTQAAFTELLDTMSRFHNYSLGNQILITLQRPGATRVAGLRKWNEFGRKVNKGESAIWIWAPRRKKARSPDAEANTPANQAEAMERELDRQAVQDSGERLRFVPVKVFDIGQTDGPPLPGEELNVTLPDEDGVDFQRLSRAAEVHLVDEGCRINVTPEPRLSNHAGTANHATREIRIDAGLSDSARFGVLAHEAAHLMLHGGKEEGVRAQELEAEAVSYVVCRHFQVPTRAPNYLAFMAGPHTPEELKQRLDTITRGARALIQGIGHSLEHLPVEMAAQPLPEDAPETLDDDLFAGSARPSSPPSKPARSGRMEFDLDF